MSSEIRIPIDNKNLSGLLAIPNNAKGLILFSHGSGSGRLSPRNQFVADFLEQASFATLLVDLLTEHEDQDYQNRFNIELLAERLISILKWLKVQEGTKSLEIGLFGASTGAAAALQCCAKVDNTIKAVVSRGGRPDLAMSVLPLVTAPTLLIVGGNDKEVITLNKLAFNELNSIKKLEIIPEATHLFEEPGALEKVAMLACYWFKQYLEHPI